MTIKEYTDLLKNGENLEECVGSFVSSAQEKNQELNSFVEVFSDIEEQIKEIKQKDSSLPLYGVPVAVKDNILIKGRTASAGSHILEHYSATYDATVVRKLKEAGAFFVGRTNMDEFAMGGSTETSYYGPAKNPHDTKRVAGGSSGGSAISVAQGAALCALGSDTGGSIRQPASFCGVVGLKPTYGAVSRYGLIAMASSLDQIGPFAGNVTDAEILFNVIKGRDPLDSTSLTSPKKNSQQKGTLAYPKKFLEEGVDARVLSNFNESCEKLKSAGYSIEEVDISNIENALACYYIIMPAEASSNLARFDGVRYGLSKDTGDSIQDFFDTRAEGFGKEVKRRIMLGTYVLSSGYYDAYYKKAIAVRNKIREGFGKVFSEYDAVLMPTSPTPAFAIGEKTNDPLQMYLADIFTTPANLAGIPGISIPSGFAEEGGKKLPLGLQVLAPHFHEQTLFDIGKKFEKVV